MAILRLCVSLQVRKPRVLVCLTWTEVDTDEQRQSGDQSTSKLQAPRNAASVLDCQVCAGAEEDAKSCPHLPAHDERTTNRRRSILGTEDGNGGTFAAHAETEQQSSDEKLVPCLSDSGANGGEGAEDGRDEDGTATTEKAVQRVRAPAATVGLLDKGAENQIGGEN